MLLNKKQHRFEQKHEKNQPKISKTVFLSKQSAVATRQKSLKSAICSPVQFIPTVLKQTDVLTMKKYSRVQGWTIALGADCFLSSFLFPLRACSDAFDSSPFLVPYQPEFKRFGVTRKTPRKR